MRTLLLSVFCTGLVAACALIAAGSRAGPQPGVVKVRVRLVDADSGKALAGIVRAFSKDSTRPHPLPGLFPRLRGLNVPEEFGGWYVVPAAGAPTEMPREALRLEALSGLETERAGVDLDLRKGPPTEVTIKLKALARPAEQGLIAGNTHLHLMKLTPEQADAYLKS